MECLEPERNEVIFHSASGPLTVTRAGAGYVMDFPARPSKPVAPPRGMAEALGVSPVVVFVNQFNYMALLANAQILRDLAPDMASLARLDRTGVIVTAQDDEDEGYDFVSRYFAPARAFQRIP